MLDTRNLDAEADTIITDGPVSYGHDTVVKGPIVLETTNVIDIRFPGATSKQREVTTVFFFSDHPRALSLLLGHLSTHMALLRKLVFLLLLDSFVQHSITSALLLVEPFSLGMRSGRQLTTGFFRARIRVGQGHPRSLHLPASNKPHSPFHQRSLPKPSSTLIRFTSAIPTPPPPIIMTTKTSDDGSETLPPPYSDYERWVRRLYETNMFHPVKMGLNNIEQLHAAMGKPMDHKNCTVIHIAGTNGKGSVALKIANTLQLIRNRNLKVGLFCSPHISSFRERMQINGKLITEEEVVALLPRIYELCRIHDIPATFFEITTALAFSYYASHQADVVVLETGLGGRLDATNVVKAPALSIITSIGLEHTRILGDTIEKIAWEKGGIIKPSCPVLVGPNVPHHVLRKCAADKGASQYLTCEDVLGDDDDDDDVVVPNGEDNKESIDNDKDFVDYDLENSRIATAALRLLQRSHPHLVGSSIPKDVIRDGVSIRPPCRFELVEKCDEQGRRLQVILDVAHNPPAMDHLVRKLKRTYPKRKFRMVVGMSSDKDLGQCGASVLRAVDGDERRVHLVEAAHPRAAKLQSILEATKFRAVNYDFQDPSITKQIHAAMKQAFENDEILVVCGSVFLMAEAREALGFDEPRDSDYIAAMAGAGVRHGQENFGNTTTMTN